MSESKIVEIIDKCYKLDFLISDREIIIKGIIEFVPVDNSIGDFIEDGLDEVISWFQQTDQIHLDEKRKIKLRNFFDEMIDKWIPCYSYIKNFYLKINKDKDKDKNIYTIEYYLKKKITPEDVMEIKRGIVKIKLKI